VLHEAQRRRTLATGGVYAYVRHPQYVGFVLVKFGFLLQWPTLLTLAMFPVLVFMYARLARSEEREALAEFGSHYERYMRGVPGLIPRLSDLTGGPKHGSAGRPDGVGPSAKHRIGFQKIIADFIAILLIERKQAPLRSPGRSIATQREMRCVPCRQPSAGRAVTNC